MMSGTLDISSYNELNPHNVGNGDILIVLECDTYLVCVIQYWIFLYIAFLALDPSETHLQIFHHSAILGGKLFPSQ
jgi:hypothetical protein